MGSEWRRLISDPVPFDTPGPPRPLDRWSAQLVGDPRPVLVTVAGNSQASKNLVHERQARGWAAQQGVPVPTEYGHGDGWMVTELVPLLPSEGAPYVDAALAAAARIRAAATPPPEAVSQWSGSRRTLLQRLYRSAWGGLPLREFRRVRSEAEQLPKDSWIHGDFSDANVLHGPDGIAVIDWEFVGRGPALADEARLWSTLGDQTDRDRVVRQVTEACDRQERLHWGILLHWLALRHLAENLASGRRHRNERYLNQARTNLVEARRWRELLSEGTTAPR